MKFRLDNEVLSRHLDNATKTRSDAMQKLSSGSNFTPQDPRPAERALADGLEFRLRSLAASKRSIQDAVSVMQTAEGGLSEINNIVTRMKELNLSAASTTISDRERRYLFIEYQALYDEVNRIAETTDFNGLPLLNGNSEKAPDSLVFRLDAPFMADDSGYDEKDDPNIIRFDGLKGIVATAAGLGLRSAKDLILYGDNSEGVSLRDVGELMEADDNSFATNYDHALANLSTFRSLFGALQSRMQRSTDFIEVYEENILAAKSKIADIDYAKEVARMAEATILQTAATSLLAQSNYSAQLTLNLISNLNR